MDRRIIPFICLLIFLTGCATSDETMALRNNISAIYNEIALLKNDMNSRISELSKEGVKDRDQLRRQLVAISNNLEGWEEKMRSLEGKMAELDYQVQAYRKDTNAEFAQIKNELVLLKNRFQPPPPQKPEQRDDVKYESLYREAFDTFQSGAFDKAIERFSSFIKTYPNTPFTPSALYWLGESYMNIKEYEKAILVFQEIIDKYPKNDKASRALLSQAEAFYILKDEKSSITILKKVIELYPKTEESIIAERRLRKIGLR
ncbi:MAG: tol-pal system protein YbgF [Syntrophorhabdaceae bacterium]|nr:tol-pal system protein YbgF [Syntrophorhabdaceae bacterium]